MEKSFAPAAPQIRDTESNNEIAGTQALITPYAEAQEKPADFFQIQIVDRLITLRNKYFPQLSEGNKTQLHEKSQKNDLPRRELLKRFGQLGTAVIGASVIGGIFEWVHVPEAKAASLDYPDVESTVGNFVYNGADAASYADKWAISYYVHDDLSHGGSFEPNGEDCTNFVSNCLFAGGMPMTSEWYSQWDYGIWWEHTSSWTAVPDLLTYLLNSKIAQVTKIIHPNEVVGFFDGLAPGDLIFYDWGDGKSISHAAIQTTPNNTEDRVDSHTIDRKDANWQLFPYNQANYTTTTFYLVHIISNTAQEH